MADVLDINDAVDLEVDDDGERELLIFGHLGRRNLTNKLFSVEGVLRLKDKVLKRKGRGFVPGETREHEKIRSYETVDGDDSGDEPGPQKCKLDFHWFAVRFSIVFFVCSCGGMDIVCYFSTRGGF